MENSWGFSTHEQITLRDGQQQFDERRQRILQRAVAVQAEDAEVDVVSGQRRLERREADGDSLQPQRVQLFLGHISNVQDPRACKCPVCCIGKFREI